MAFANDVISLEDLKARMQGESAGEEAIQLQLLSRPITDKPTAKLTPQEVIEVASSIKENWNYLELEHKKLIVQTLFSEIVVDTHGEAVGGPGRRVSCEIISLETK